MLEFEPAMYSTYPFIRSFTPYQYSCPCLKFAISCILWPYSVVFLLSFPILTLLRRLLSTARRKPFLRFSTLLIFNYGKYLSDPHRAKSKEQEKITSITTYTCLLRNSLWSQIFRWALEQLVVGQARGLCCFLTGSKLLVVPYSRLAWGWCTVDRWCVQSVELVSCARLERE